ncbi:MAG: protein kinase, partial [Thermoguttaceae bacterium]
MASAQLDILAIFGEALARKSDEERSRYLDEACRTDPQVRERVESLLRAHSDAGGFLGGQSPGRAATVDQPITEKPGITIGRYKLLEEIGEGGMGVVYKAEQQEPVHRQVALKILKPGMDTRRVIARFEAERQALAMMDHPSIAHVYDAGTAESGRPYFVMELVDGTRLTDYCDQQQLATRQRLELFVQVCLAVQHAHQKGIIHRDLKPSNVLVTLYDDVPVPKIIDFGIAKAMHRPPDETALTTGHGLIMGTPLYMSPEQAGTGGLDVDTRSDIYSLGVVVYELLTGSTPFDQERVQKAGYNEIGRMIREEEPPRPSARISTLGEAAAATLATNRKTEPARLSRLLRGDLDWIVMKALEKDPARRYQTAAELAQDIQRHLANEPIDARPPSLLDHAAKWSRRHRPLVGSAAVFLVLSTIGLAISTLLIAGAYTEKNQQLTATEKAEKMAREQEGLAKQQEGMAKEQRKVVEAQKEEAVKQREISDGNLYLAHMRLARHDWEQGQISRLHEMLDSHFPQPGRPDLRGWEWYYYLSLCHKELFTLRGNGTAVYSAAWSPDGNRLASVGNGGTIQIWSAATGQEIFKFSAGNPLYAVAWSPDGKRLATGSRDGTARIWDAATRKEIFAFHGFNGQVLSVAWSPDGRHLAAGADTVKVWDAAKGQEIVDLKGKARFPVAWSPDGKRLATGRTGFDFQILDALTGRELRSFSSPVGADLFSLAWSPDGKRLASGQYVNWARVWEADTGRELLKMWHAGSVEQVAWSADGKRLATASRAQRVTVWDATTGKETLCLRGHRGPVVSVAWSPDGARLASAGPDGTVKIWNALGKQDALAIDRAGAEGLAWSPKGNRLASAGGGKLRLWDPRTGEEVWSFEEGAAGGHLAWSADGKYLAVNKLVTKQQEAAKQKDVVIVDTETGKRVLLPTNGWAAVSWSPAAARLAIVDHGPYPTEDVEICDISTGSKVVWHGPSAEGACLWSPAWSPDGSRLALAEAGLVTIWDAATETRLFVLRGHARGWVFSVAWSPDGRRLASGSG